MRARAPGSRAGARARLVAGDDERPRARAASASTSSTSVRAEASRPEYGSSRSRSSGPWSRTRQSASRCCIPRENDPDALVPPLPEPEALEQRADPLAPLGHVVEAAVEVEVLERGQLAVDERLVREVADPSRAGDRPRARRPSAREAGHEGEERRLPRAVRARDERGARRPHLEVEVAKDALRAEPPSEAARRDHTSTSRRTKTKNVTLMTPFMVKNAMSSRFQSRGETSECS